MVQAPPDRVPPSAAAYAIAAALVSFVLGYFVGAGSSIGLFGLSPSPSAPSPKPGRRSPPDDDDDDPDSDADSQDDASDLGDLQSFAGNTEECKLVLLVRNDLGMGKGKIAAQCAHATLACYKSFLHADPNHPILKQWESLGQAKVALRIDSEDEMLLLQAQAVSLGLCARVIHDAGRTQIASGSATVLGIGPAPKSKIDEVTSHLRLL